MANLQYIGARYVPKVYNNPDDHSAAWKSGVGYESLTIVTYNDDSYTSRQPVPSTVGNPANNPTYWAKTGDFNASLTALQNQVNQNTGNIDDILDRSWLYGKKIVAYGDSTICDNEGGAGESYLVRACRAGGAILTNRAVAGTEMATNPNNGVSLINQATDIASFDYVVLAYGTNEWTTQKTHDVIIASTNSIINKVREKDPKAQIIFLLAPHSHHDWQNGYDVNHNSQNYDLKDVQNLIISVLNTKNVRFIDLNKRSSCNDNNYERLMDSSGWGVHPKPAFRVELAGIVLQGPNIERHECYTPIIDNMDFVSARTGAWSDFPGYWRGYALNIASTSYSTKKFFQDKYPIRFVGEVLNGGSATITIGTKTLTVSGVFDVKLIPAFGVQRIQISGTNIQIKDFMAYAVSDYPIVTSHDYMFGANFITNYESMFTSGLSMARIKDGVRTKWQLKTIQAGNYSSGTTLFTMPSDLQFDMQSFWIYSNSGTPYSVFLSGNAVKFTNATSFASDTQLVFPSMEWKNEAYPNAAFSPT